MRAHFPEQQLVLETNQAHFQYSQLDTKVLKSVRTPSMFINCYKLTVDKPLTYSRTECWKYTKLSSFLFFSFFFLSFFFNKCSQTRKRSNKVFSAWYLVWHSYRSTIMWLVCHSSWIHVKHHWVCIPKQQQRHDGRHRWIGNCWWLNYTPLIDLSSTCT